MSRDQSLPRMSCSRLRPAYRVFAWSLCRNADHADDLVQETLTRAIARISTFQRGTACRLGSPRSCATALAIRCASGATRISVDPEGAFERSMASLREQEERLLMDDLSDALGWAARPSSARLSSWSARGCMRRGEPGLAVRPGTIQSRASRGRARLAELLSVESTVDLGPEPGHQGGDRRQRSALGGSSDRRLRPSADQCWK